jgi:hypothetical protein
MGCKAYAIKFKDQIRLGSISTHFELKLIQG